ncbi:MAG TPA: reverse transcriptase domain-containing protein [Pirellulaceae bacterium]|jgi:hypothetical protein|nr:reverse transcriptase domain-containing protein [Pirellulaceae bacterium]
MYDRIRRDERGYALNLRSNSRISRPSYVGGVLSNAHIAARDPAYRARFLGDVHLDAFDPRMLAYAFEILYARNSSARDADGRTYEDFPVQIRWNELTEFHRRALIGDFSPQPFRCVKVEKPSGGFREIHIQTVLSKVVQKSIQLLLQPILEATFRPFALAYRKGKSIHDALLRLALSVRYRGAVHFCCDDVRDAFGSVPISRLRHILRRYLINEPLVERMLGLSAMGGARGIVTGGVVSPDLLNLFLHHVVDRLVRLLDIDAVLRYSDDFAFFGATIGHVARLRHEAVVRLQPQGMHFQVAKPRIIDLRESEAEYLGFKVAVRNEELMIRLTRERWKKLRNRLGDCHCVPNAPLAIREVVTGWLVAAGPACGPKVAGSTAKKVREHVRSCGYGELFAEMEIERVLNAEYSKWEARLEAFARSYEHDLHRRFEHVSRRSGLEAKSRSESTSELGF